MRIAQIAPLYESVPPKAYGGTERIVSYITEELVNLGHQVTLFASGDSVTRARLLPQCERAFRVNERVIDSIAHHVLMTERLSKMAADFDVIHSHIDYFPYSMFRRIETPALTTLHGRLDLEDLYPMYREFDDIPVVSISRAQRKPLPWVNWEANVYHGIPQDLLTYQEKPGSYLAFLGRICQEKRLDIAIKIAISAGRELKIAAKIDRVDAEYFTTVIKPLMNHPLIEYIGEIGDSEKNAFLGNAAALLFPIDWPEPFGLVMIEAMACGTPVIAHPRGSVLEIIDPGVTGYIVNDLEEAVEAVGHISAISRRRCRDTFETRFTASRMARDYVQIYQRLIEKESPPQPTLVGDHG